MPNKDIDKLLQIIKNDTAQRRHFFKKIASADDPLSYLGPLYKAGYFSPEGNLPPREVPYQKGSFAIPYWDVLVYLEHVAEQNEVQPSGSVAETLLKIVNAIIDYENRHRIDNYHTDTSIVRILSHIPIDKITEQHVDFVDTILKSKWRTVLVPSEIGKRLLPKLINPVSKVLLLKLLSILFQYSRKKGILRMEYTSIIEDHSLSDILETNKIGIASLAAKEAADLALAKMREIIAEDESQFSIYAVRTIEDHEQERFPKDYECQMVRFVRDMFRNSIANIVKPTIDELLSEKHPIFRRLAIGAIDAHYANLNSLFWDCDGNPLQDPHLKHEIYSLLKNHCSVFTQIQVDTVLKWIESKEYCKGDTDQAEKIEAYRKKEWLSALLRRKDAKIQNAFEKYDRINPAKLAHPGFSVWTEVGFRQPISPISQEVLNGKNNADIAKYLSDFQGGDDISFTGPSIEGLSDCFKLSVTENPNKYANSMVPFASVNIAYKSGLLSGLREAWRKGRHFELEGVFDFVLQTVSTNELWAVDTSQDIHDYRDWFASTVAEFITEGTKNDSNAFDQKYLATIEKILLLLAERVKSKEVVDKDLISHVINSTKGNIFIAMVNYALRYRRTRGKDDANRWPESIKDAFNRRLDRSVDPSIEYSIVLGMYLPQLLYLDAQWVTDNIDIIFPREKEEHWIAAFAGYLSGGNKVYADIYSLLKDHNHYETAVNTHFTGDHATERLVQHGCLSYLEGWEQIDDDKSLIGMLVNKADAEELREIVHFVWTFRDKLNDERERRVRHLWKKLVGVLSKFQKNPEYRLVIVNLYQWLCLVQDFDDDVYELMCVSISHTQVEYELFSIVEYLLKHVGKSPQEVANLYLLMLEKGIYPEFEKGNIEEIMRELYQHDYKKEADTICTLYLRNGYDFLREIYRQQQNSSGPHHPSL